MRDQTTFDLHQLLPGCWKLEAGRALTLHPRDSGVLRIAHGRVWITMDGPHHGHANESGDLFLVPGRGLVVQAGQRLVVESSGEERSQSAHFSWDPLPQQRAQAVDSAVRRAGRWQMAVVQPVRDLGMALGMAAAALGLAGSALGRLALGIAGLAEFLIAGRGRVMARLESNQP